MERLFLSAFAAIALSGTAMAADEMTSTAPYNAPMFYGYVDIFGGYNRGRASGEYGFLPEMWQDDWEGSVFGGSARLAARLAPSISVQGDVWANTFRGDATEVDTAFGVDNYSYTNNYPGIGGHVTWRGDNGMMFGALGSYGASDDYGNYVNLGLEGVYETGQWRFYGQAGHAFGVSGDADDENDRTWYAAGVVTYYHTPNLAISGSASVESAKFDGFFPGDFTGVNWGARVDYKPDNFPFITYVAYRGWHGSGSDVFPSSWSRNEHAIVVGVRMPLNGMSVQETHHEVGLSDMNPVFGDPFAN